MDEQPPASAPRRAVRATRRIATASDEVGRRIDQALSDSNFMTRTLRPFHYLGTRVDAAVDPLERWTRPPLSRAPVDRLEIALEPVGATTEVEVTAEVSTTWKGRAAAPVAGVAAAGFLGATTMIGGYSPIDLLAIPSAIACIVGGLWVGRALDVGAAREARRALVDLLSRLDEDG